MAGTPVKDWVVDPSIAGDSGTGTPGDPFGDLQYALNQVGTSPGRQVNGGDAFHIKGGTAEIMTAKLSRATYGTPTLQGPLILRGFTTSLYDGGIAQISGNNGTYPIWDETAAPGVHIQDLELYDCGSGAFVVRTGSNSSVINCEVHGCNGTGISVGTHSVVANCRTYDLGSGSSGNRAILTGQHCEVVFCWYETSGSRTIGDAAIELNSNSLAEGNIVILRGASEGGIEFAGQSVRAIHNTVWNIANGTKIGLNYGVAGNSIIANVIAGFAGVGGKGLSNINPGVIANLRRNGFYNSEKNVHSTMESITSDMDATISSNPWSREGAQTYANRYTYFKLQDVWPLAKDWKSLGAGYEGRDAGAVQGVSVTSGDVIPRNHNPLLRM